MNKKSVVQVVAVKEFRDSVRNFWLVTGSAVFALLTFAILFGTAAIGGNFVFRPFETVMDSMTMIGVFFIPLIAIMISYDAFSGEYESGTLMLLLTYPISRVSLLTGKLLGQGFALVLCILSGILPVVLLKVVGVLPYTFKEIFEPLLLFFGSGITLGVIFILLSYFVSLINSTKGRSLAMLMAIWLVVVFLYDLGLLIVTVAGDGGLSSKVLAYLMVLNPTSAFRMFNQQEQGLITIFSSARLELYLLLWVVALFLLDSRIFARKLY